ncbi:hypothetical protein MtrunA17_Chr1g0201301 [Medicago truncatula]|uniref:Uncharacterized protein n=1 Tax=Medicago truncatula TaxID=3880 RepID=A0A396K0M0_MEDTR|nr:hypothetical protein MtrunA17_Chr1g0201301 [Medicago truncatula]
MEKHGEFRKLMNNFKSLRIDTVGDTTTLEDVYKKLIIQLILDNMAKMDNCGDEFYKTVMDLINAQRIDTTSAEARLEEYYKAYQGLKLAFNSLSKLLQEYQIHITIHEVYQGISDRIDNYESRLQHFFDILVKVKQASIKHISN